MDVSTEELPDNGTAGMSATASGGAEVTPANEDPENNSLSCNGDAPDTTARDRASPWMAAIKLKYPRSYNITFKIFIPLFFLIGLSFFGGYLLVLAESPIEMEDNDAITSYFIDFAVRASSRPVFLGETDLELCAATINITEDIDLTTQQLRECAAKFAGQEHITAPITFNWITCSEDGQEYGLAWEDQFAVYVDAWLESYRSIVSQSMASSNASSFQDAHTEAIGSASGHDECKVNVAAGALFWFTIMTTIGYGNVAPVTRVGQGLIYSLGFFSILAFTAVISQAGTIFLAIFDDFAHRVKMPCLTKGLWASLLWLTTWWLWVLTIAGIATRKSQGTFPLRTSFWFSYISTTTVGLGDYHMEHETFLARDMFYIPFLFLLGFVLLANFLHKLSELLSGWCSDSQSLESILESQRNSKEENGKGESQ